MSHKHLSPFERGQIQAMISAGASVRQIAHKLGRSPSTISREIRRNKSARDGYNAQKAQERYKERRKACRRTRRLDYEPLRQYVVEKMISGWSPEQISGRAEREHPTDPFIRVSTETIYQFIDKDPRWGPVMRPHLRQARRRRRRGTRRKVRSLIPNRVGIEQRPDCVNELARYGDWEGDTLIGRNRKGAILTLVERKSLLTLAAPLETKQAAPTAEAMIRLLQSLPPHWRQTLTLDNGIEFRLHEQVSQATGIQIYFAHPCAIYERGRNDNTNGLLRQYLPKSTDVRDIPPEKLEEIIYELNNRPRKKLGYTTSLEVFLENVALRV